MLLEDAVLVYKLTRSPSRYAFYVDVGRHVELKRRMLACHRSQLARGSESDFAPLEPLMLVQCRARGAQAGVEAAEAFRIHPAWKRARAW